MSKKKSGRSEECWRNLILLLASVYYALSPFFWRGHPLSALPLQVDVSFSVLAWLCLLGISMPVFTIAYYLLSRYTHISIAAGVLFLNIASIVAAAGMRFSVTYASHIGGS